MVVWYIKSTFTEGRDKCWVMSALEYPTAIFSCPGSLPMTGNDCNIYCMSHGLCLLYGQFLNEERHFS